VNPAPNVPAVPFQPVVRASQGMHATHTMHVVPAVPGKDWVATDLDNTLFSRYWAGPGAVPGTWRENPGPDSQPGHEPSSWVRPETHRLLLLLAQAATLVPVTARDADAFARVYVPGLNLAGPAVLANGAVVLNPAGVPDPDWEKHMRTLLLPWRKKLEDRCTSLLHRSGQAARPRLVYGPAEFAAYLVAKAPDGWWQGTVGRDLFSEICAGDLEGCQITVLGNEFQLLPPGLGKGPAARFVQERYFAGQAPLLCLGDMPPDLEFMRLGGLWATPAGSNLAVLWQL